MPRRKAAVTKSEEAVEPKVKKTRLVFSLPLPERRAIVGNVFVVGSGETGQLGLGEDIMERKRPSSVSSVVNAVDVCAGGMHNLVLTSEGELYSFGCNDEGALGRDSSEAGTHEALPARVDLPAKVVRLAAGDSHSACILDDGRVYAWGSFRDSHGNMGLTIDGNKRTPVHLLPDMQCHDIASGADHLVMLTTTGKIFTVGCAEQGQLGRISERSVSGEGRRGKIDLLRPTELVMRKFKPIDAIWATNYCTFMREFSTNAIYAVGLNNYKQLAFDGSHERILTPKKTIFDDVKQLAGGQHHTLVLSTSGKCYAIGRQDYGRLGLGPVDPKHDGQLVLVQALADKKIAMIACGESCSYAITDDGKLYAWGFGESYQLGVGDGEDELTPKLVESKSTANAQFLLVSGGGQHAIFLVNDTAGANKEAEPKKTAAKRKATAAVAAKGSSTAREQQNGVAVKTESDTEEPPKKRKSEEKAQQPKKQKSEEKPEPKKQKSVEKAEQKEKPKAAAATKRGKKK